MVNMDTIGAVVLVDPDTGQPYAYDALDALENNGPGILGGVVLIDPDTKEPYKIG